MFQQLFQRDMSKYRALISVPTPTGEILSVAQKMESRAVGKNAINFPCALGTVKETTRSAIYLHRSALVHLDGTLYLAPMLKQVTS